METWMSVCVVVLATIGQLLGDNLQEWSHQAEEGKNFALYCTPTDLDREPNVTSANIVKWFKRGVSEQIQHGANGPYFIRDHEGVDSELIVMPVTEASAGIYFCKVYTLKDDEFVGTIVKGLNIAGPRYADKLEHYKENIITGAIAGGAVFFIICFACFLDNFRYLTPEQKQKRHDRKQERLAKQARLRKEGVDNFGMDIDDTDKNIANGDHAEVNTQL